MKKLIYTGIFGMLGLSLFNACTRYKADRLYPVSNCIADTIDTVSFKNNIQPLFTQNCALSGCHSGLSPEGGLDLELDSAYAELRKPGSGYVDTLSPESSLLYNKLTSATNYMPPTGKLDDCTIKLIVKWMRQNAPNN